MQFDRKLLRGEIFSGDESVVRLMPRYERRRETYEDNEGRRDEETGWLRSEGTPVAISRGGGDGWMDVNAIV